MPSPETVNKEASNKYQFDIIIFGAGIAGLWLLNVLKQQGYNALLLEKNTVGGEQTIHSQGIIHGGLKYALSGTLNSESDSIAEMPGIWRQCLQGDTKEPHLLSLPNTRVLSDTQYMWSTGGLASKFTTFFASKVLRGRIEKLSRKNYPEALANPAFKGNVFRLSDLVIDTDSLLKDLMDPVKESVLRLPGENPEFKNTDEGVLVTINEVVLQAKAVIFSAGYGNGQLMQLAGLDQGMQDRPLQMVMVKHQYILPFYGHCIGASSKPRITITSHQPSANEMIWYLGGELSEEGTAMDPGELIKKGKAELGELFPWLDFSDAQWATWKGTRAEPKQNQLIKPDSAYVAREGSFLSCWPTKLTLAPDLAEKVLGVLQDIQPSKESSALPAFPAAEITGPFWENSFD